MAYNMLSKSKIRCMGASFEDEPIPLFVGRDDGTVEKYISISDADLGQPSLVLRGHKKAVTGVSVVTPDEVYTCSLDGTIKVWNAEVDAGEGTVRVVRSVSTQVALYCVAQRDGRIYAGGADGALHVLDGHRRSAWDGHSDVLSCISFTPSGLAVTGGYDNQVRVWDLSLGKTVRLLMGHLNHVKCICVIGGGEDEEEEGRGTILSFSLDGAMKVWEVPEIVEGEEEEEFLGGYGEPEEGKRGAVVSFREDNNVAVEVENVVAGDHDITFETPSSGELQTSSLLRASTPPLSEETDGAPQQKKDDISVVDPINDIINNPDLAAKSAIKVKGKPLVKREDALGTFELPEAPEVLYQPEESPMIYLGCSNGYVFGIHASSIARTVLNFVAINRAKVRQEVRATKLTLKQSTALANKECRKAVRAEEGKLLRVARRTLREKKKAEREEKQKERAARAAERAALRAQRAEEYDEEDEEDEYYDEGDEEYDEDDDEEHDGEEEDEEGDEEGEANPLRILSEEQRTALTEFVKAREAERDEKIGALSSAVTQHLAVVEPLAKSTYDRTKDQFFRLKTTTYAKVGGEAAVALCTVGDRVYAGQGARIVPTEVTMGLTRL